MRILVVEDEMRLATSLEFILEKKKHTVDLAFDGETGLDKVLSGVYDVIVLDYMLPKMSGIEILKEAREYDIQSSIIMLTAKGELSDKILGLNNGADDYLVKPFDLSELSARIAAVSRRYAGNPNPIITIGALEVDMTQHLISRDGVTVNLTAREWALLEAFIQRPGTLLSKSQLEDHLYAFGSEIESNTIEVYISRLRKKLGKDQLETVRGLGYRMGYSGHRSR